MTGHSGIVTEDSGRSRKSVTFNQNRRSRSVGTTGHVQTESAVKIVRNTHEASTCRPTTWSAPTLTPELLFPTLVWIPVGRDRGNKGRIALANIPVNPIAERTVNGMEALIEMARQRELLKDPNAPAPVSPRDAVGRYFGLPPLDQLPKPPNVPESKVIQGRARELARQLRVRLLFDKKGKEFTVSIEDDGIGQTPASIHRTLLSLGSTTKADKWYLIGVFGQGGSSAYAVSKYSWVLSRRAPDLLHGDSDGAGWTVIKHVFPKGRRDDYFAYLACSPEAPSPSSLFAIQNGAGVSFRPSTCQR